MKRHNVSASVLSICATSGNGLVWCEKSAYCEHGGAPWSGSVMAKKVKKAPFDPKTFLATLNGGRTISQYRKDQTVFSQGNSADAVFYIRSGRVKVTVVSEQGKEAVVAILGPDQPG
jgi:hypothetical protein